MHRSAGRRWYRFRLRTLFVGITLFCICLTIGMWLKTRRNEFARKMDEFDSGPVQAEFQGPPGITAAEREFLAAAEDAWFVSIFNYNEQQHQKYAYAYKYPWLSVAPDPPQPKFPFRGDAEMLLYLKKHGLR